MGVKREREKRIFRNRGIDGDDDDEDKFFRRLEGN